MWSLLPLMGSAVLCKKVSHIVTTLSEDKQQDKKPTQEHVPPGQLPVARDQGIACEEQKVSRIATTLPEGKHQHLASDQDPKKAVMEYLDEERPHDGIIIGGDFVLSLLGFGLVLPSHWVRV